MRRYVRPSAFFLGFAMASLSPHAQTRARLADYFTEMPVTVLDAAWQPRYMSGETTTADLDGDGFQDLIVLGAAYPLNGDTEPVPQPGRVFLGDGNGHFSPAPAALFPVDTLLTVHPLITQFEDFNGDGRSDTFITTQGWDTYIPTPQQGEQNRLYLSTPEGGWSDATGTLPQLEDFSHTSATGDISGRGLVDIFVGNGFRGKNNIAPYTLLNTGGGHFTRTTSNVPAGPGQLLDPMTAHTFVGSKLADLNGDGLPELIIGTNKSNTNQKLQRSLVLWNRAGVFSETDVTELPQTTVFEQFHQELSVQTMDIDQDGLLDVLLVGIEPEKFYGGWFLQVVMNKGNRQFVDETAERVPAGDRSKLNPTANSVPQPRWIRVLDFNGDGALDFSVEFKSGGAAKLTANDPLVWINDGTGHFVTLKASDFVAPGRESALGTGHLMPTRYGYSFITPTYNPSDRARGLRLTGVLATKPYQLVPPSAAVEGR